MLFCVNNNSHDRIAGNKKKAVGVTPGVADLAFVDQGVMWFIELKVGNNTTSKEQDDFRDKVLSRGHYYIIIRDFDSFKNLICRIIGR
jgi:hypothetical protein